MDEIVLYQSCFMDTTYGLMDFSPIAPECPKELEIGNDLPCVPKIRGVEEDLLHPKLGKLMKKRRVHRRNYNRFTIYLNKVRRVVHPGSKVSKDVYRIIDCFIYDVLRGIGEEARTLLLKDNKKTLGARTVEFAVKFYVQGTIGWNARRDGRNALVNWLHDLNWFPFSVPSVTVKEEQD